MNAIIGVLFVLVVGLWTAFQLVRAVLSGMVASINAIKSTNRLRIGRAHLNVKAEIPEELGATPAWLRQADREKAALESYRPSALRPPEPARRTYERVSATVLKVPHLGRLARLDLGAQAERAGGLLRRAA